MGTISGVHGPALALAYARSPIQEARATVALIFVLACAASLCLRAVSGLVDPVSALSGLGLSLMACAGWGVSRTVILPEIPARRLALCLVVVSGVTLLLRG